MKNFWVMTKGFIGILIILIIVGLANMLPINNFYFEIFLSFINENLHLIILFSILFLLGELFYLFVFPVNLPAPIFNAYGGYFLTLFIFRIFYLIDDILEKDLLSVFSNVERITLFIVFVLILILGLLKTFTRKRKIEKREEVNWEDIGNEFKEGIYNLAVRFRQVSKPKEKNKEVSKKNFKKKKDDY